MFAGRLAANAPSPGQLILGRGSPISKPRCLGRRVSDTPLRPPDPDAGERAHHHHSMALHVPGGRYENHHRPGRRSCPGSAATDRDNEKGALVRQALGALIERESARRLAQLAGSEPDGSIWHRAVSSNADLGLFRRQWLYPRVWVDSCCAAVVFGRRRFSRPLRRRVTATRRRGEEKLGKVR